MADSQDIAARLVPDLMRELGLSREQALGLVGNLAHESMGFKDLTENGVRGRGGYGYAQWTGDRRTKFENYAKAQGLKPSSYEANLGFIVKELKGSEKAALNKIKSASSADQAASVAMKAYFRPGKPQLTSRQDWTNQFAASLPNSALAAINAVAPTPMPSRPVALGYTQNTGTPAPKGSYTLDPPAMPLNVPLPPRASQWQETGGPVMRGDVPMPRPRPAPPAPARGVGTSYLAPPTKVATYKVDMNGNPIIPQAREPLPSERVVPAAVPRLMAQANAAAAQAPKMPAPTVRPPVLTAAQRSALASTGSTAPPVAPVPRTKPTFPVAMAQNGTYTPAPPPVNLLAKADQSRLPTGTYDPGGDAIMAALYPRPATPPAVSAINAATAPSLPRMPSPAMSAARLPTVPVRSAPVPAARVPLTQFNTVNPMTQIVPAVQARAGQGLIGRLFNMATAGVVPQANTSRSSGFSLLSGGGRATGDQLASMQAAASLAQDPALAAALASGAKGYVPSNPNDTGVLGPGALMPTVALNGNPIRNR